jgi:hypothetical protein
MPDAAYYTRIKGEVQGPFTEEEMCNLVRQARLGRFDKVSTDQRNWRKAEEFAQFFAVVTPKFNVAAPSAPAHGSNSAAFDPFALPADAIAPSPAISPERARPAGPIPTAPLPVASPSAPSSATWYYADANERRGPVSKQRLVELLATGRLAASELVWMQGMPQWAPAQSVAELATAKPEDSRKWCFASGDRQGGPMAKPQIVQMLQSGELTPADQVWSEGMSEWMPIHSLSAEFSDGLAHSPIAFNTAARSSQAKGSVFSGMAIACLIISLIPLCGLNAPISIVFGIVAIQQIMESKGRLRGKPLAFIGIAISFFSLAAWAAIAIAFR